MKKLILISAFLGFGNAFASGPLSYTCMATSAYGHFETGFLYSLETAQKLACSTCKQSSPSKDVCRLGCRQFIAATGRYRPASTPAICP